MLLIWLRCTSPQVRGLNGRSPNIEACELAPSQNCLRGLSIAQWVIFVERRWVNGDERQGGPESRALIEALLMLLQVLMTVFMEKSTSKSSTNSSKPSS